MLQISAERFPKNLPIRFFVYLYGSGRSTTTLGRHIDRTERNTEPPEPKIAKIFKRPKNREDGLDLDDFWMESIVSAQSIFSKIFERTKNYRTDRTDRFDRSIARSIVPTDGRRAHAAAAAAVAAPQLLPWLRPWHFQKGNALSEMI